MNEFFQCNTFIHLFNSFIFYTIILYTICVLLATINKAIQLIKIWWIILYVSNIFKLGLFFKNVWWCVCRYKLICKTLFSNDFFMYNIYLPIYTFSYIENKRIFLYFIYNTVYTNFSFSLFVKLYSLRINSVLSRLS